MAIATSTQAIANTGRAKTNAGVPATAVVRENVNKFVGDTRTVSLRSSWA